MKGKPAGGGGSALEAKLGDIGRSSNAEASGTGSAPWDPFGKPVLGKSALGKMGSLNKLESKPL